MTFEIRLENGMLIAHNKIHGDMHMRPTIADEFIGDWSAELQFARDDAQNLSGFRLNLPQRMRGILFRKNG